MVFNIFYSLCIYDGGSTVVVIARRSPPFCSLRRVSCHHGQLGLLLSHEKMLLSKSRESRWLRIIQSFFVNALSSPEHDNPALCKGKGLALYLQKSSFKRINLL
jgi:hypothetical protein